MEGLRIFHCVKKRLGTYVYIKKLSLRDIGADYYKITKPILTLDYSYLNLIYKTLWSVNLLIAQNLSRGLKNT